MKMDFDKCWNEHLNQGDDAVTLGMIDRYGIAAVRQLAELAFRMGEQNDIQKKTICRLIRQLRLMALAHGGKPDAATLYDAADWLQRLGGITRKQTERVNE
jgi:hypothetical protein